MKRLLKSWVFWVFVALPLVVGAVLFSERTETAENCGGCLSCRSRTQWLFVLEDVARVPLTAPTEDVTESHVHRDLMTGAHEHQWRVFGRKGKSLWGSDRELFVDFANDVHLPAVMMARSPLWLAYECDPGFRDFIQGKIRRGEASRAECLAVLASPDLAARRDAWRAEYEESLARPR